MKVIIAGGRNFNNYDYLNKAMSNLEIEISEIICGCAKGADALGEKWAKENNIPIKYFPPNWNKYGKFAGPKRNLEMANYADYLIAFWDGKSKGTSNMISSMKKLNKHSKIFVYE